MLTRCLIAAEFVFPFSVGVISPSSSPFVSVFSLVPTCSRLKIPNHQPSQQGLSFRASHSGALYSRSVSDMVLQAFGFHPSGRGTRLITMGALYRQTPKSGNFGQESDVPDLGLSVTWCRCYGLISYSHLQTQLDTVSPLLCLQCSLPMIWAASFILEAFIFKLHSVFSVWGGLLPVFPSTMFNLLCC